MATVPTEISNDQGSVLTLIHHLNMFTNNNSLLQGISSKSLVMICKYGKFLFKLGVTLALLAYLCFKVDWGEIVSTLDSIKLLPFIISYIIVILSSIPLAYRLNILLKPTKLQFSINRLIQVQFISQFYSLILPSGIGIAIARWYQITRNRVGRRVFVIITLLERSMLILTLVVCAGIPLYFAKAEAIQSIRSTTLPVLFLLFLGCLLFFSIFLSSGLFNRFSFLMQWIQSRMPSALMGKITDVYKDCGLYVAQRDLLCKAFIFHLVYQGLNFIRFYMVFVALHVDLPPVTILWISMLVLLFISLPVSFGGMGIREAGFSWLLFLYGIEPERGMLLGVMISTHFLLNISIGAILNVFDARHSFQHSDNNNKIG